MNGYPPIFLASAQLCIESMTIGQRIKLAWYASDTNQSIDPREEDNWVDIAPYFEGTNEHGFPRVKEDLRDVLLTLIEKAAIK